MAKTMLLAVFLLLLRIFPNTGVPTGATLATLGLIAASFAYLEIYMYRRGLEKIGPVRRIVGRRLGISIKGAVLILIIGLASAAWAFLG